MSKLSLICLLFTSLIVGCRNEAPTHHQWNDADALFRDKTYFRGSDSAYSADLGNGRILWLFGDTFIGDAPKSRDDSIMVRNSIAIQHGYNPATATISFYTKEQNGQATAFIESSDTTWFWFGPTIKIGDKLLLTLVELALYDGGLGFQAIGSAAFIVPNPNDPPRDWILDPVKLPPMPNNVRFGTGALLLEREYLLAFMAVEPGNHDIYLARWKAADVGKGDLSSPEWFHAERGWTPDRTELSPIIKNLQTEFSVHRDLETSKVQLVSVEGFGSTNIVSRTADNPEGPWSDPTFVARPEESNRGGTVYVYSAKAHPYLTGGKTIITYSTNNGDFAALLEDMSIYFPRFLKQH